MIVAAILPLRVTCIYTDSDIQPSIESDAEFEFENICNNNYM